MLTTKLNKLGRVGKFSTYFKPSHLHSLVDFTSPALNSSILGLNKIFLILIGPTAFRKDNSYFKQV